MVHVATPQPRALVVDDEENISFLVEAALQRRDQASLARALERIQSAILHTRRKPDLAEAAARQALLALAVESARRR